MGEYLLRGGGAVIGAALGFATGVWEVFLSPLYAGRIPVPVSPVLAAVCNAGLLWFAYRVTRSKPLAVLPGLAWFAAVLLGTHRTTEGDLPITAADWMGLVTILVGALAWGVTAYRLVPVPHQDPPAWGSGGPNPGRGWGGANPRRNSGPGAARTRRERSRG